MTDKSSFDEEEWQLLIDVPMLVGTSVMMVGKSGLGSVKESFAMAQEIITAIKDYPDNQLIQSILHSRTEEGMRSTLESLKNPYIRMKPDEILEVASEKSAAVAALLDSKCNAGEAREYKEWAFYVGDKVAQAASEGGFLGFGGEQFSTEERNALNKLMDAISLTT